MKNIRKEKGITLIALVITIIVLLILAGVAITSITGENGILLRAKDAKEKTGDASNNETDVLEKYNEYINKYTENGSTGEGETPSEGGTSNGISLAENANVGDIISNYQVGDYTGDWLVLSNDGTTVNIITKDVIENVFTFKGLDHWQSTLDDQLNTICPRYLNVTYGESVRSVNIDDISINRTGSVYDFSDWPSEEGYYGDTIDYSHPKTSFAWYDINTWPEKEVLCNEYIGLGMSGFEEDILNTSNNYFLHFCKIEPDNVYWIHSGGELCFGSCGQIICSEEDTVPFGLRPVVTLKTGIKGTKDGTTWTLE